MYAQCRGWLISQSLVWDTNTKMWVLIRGMSSLKWPAMRTSYGFLLNYQKMVLIVGVVQVILRPEITMVPCALEAIFWFTLIHDIALCTGYSGYGGFCTKVVSRSTRNQSLLVREGNILLTLILWWFKKPLIKAKWILERVSNVSLFELSYKRLRETWISDWVWYWSILEHLFRM